MSESISCRCGKVVYLADLYEGEEDCPSCGRLLPLAGRNTGRKTKPPPLPQEETLLTHGGAAITEKDDFFVEAPHEIGQLFSSETTLKRGQEPTPLGMRAAIAAGLFVVGFIVVVFVISMIKGGRLRMDDLPLMMLVPSLVGLVLALIAIWATGFSHTCTYVGTEGIASFQCRGDRRNISRSELFLFRDATELRTSQTRHYHNGAYTGTNYTYTWTDNQGKTVHILTGSYNSEPGTPVPTDPFYYALAAETAWSVFLLRNIERVNSEVFFFGLAGGDYVELAQKRFILTQRGQTTELHSDQIARIHIENGVVTVWEHGAKEGWFSSTGVHKFMYQDLGNARFFMFALEKLLGIRV